jgi:hypothetical protein
MLGRRAAIGTSIAVLAVAGGGGAIAATHGSSDSTKPQVQKTVRHHHVTQTPARSGHHCSHSGDAALAL